MIIASKRQFGIFWGSEFLSVAETQRNNLVFSAVIPRQISETLVSAPADLSIVTPENIHLVAAMQRLVKDQDMARSRVYMSVPSRDVIFRSFLLPAMSPGETKNAILFEAPRYIPFKLDELYYQYQMIPFTANDVKKNQIIFLGLRRDKLAPYCKVIEDAGLDIVSIEPSLFGLLRILAAKKLLVRNQTSALVQIEEMQGSVMIIDKLIPQFIYDFNLASLDTPNLKNDLQPVSEHILNEMRISFDFYNRQTTTKPGARVEQIYLFANQQTKKLAQGLQADLGIETLPLEINDLFSYQNELHPNMASAIGASLSSATSLEFDLNLAKTRKIADAPPSQKIDVETLLAQPPSYKMTAFIALMCFLVAAAAVTITRMKLAGPEQRLSELKAISKEYQNKSSETIKESITKIDDKITTYKRLRFHSHLKAYLENISESLLQGVWLTDLEIAYIDGAGEQTEDGFTISRISATLNGYSYSDQLDQQITLIENFLENLKMNPFLKLHTTMITLKQVKKEELEKYPVTFFQIVVEAKENDG